MINSTLPPTEKRGRGQPKKYNVPTTRLSFMIPENLVIELGEMAERDYHGNKSEAIVSAIRAHLARWKLDADLTRAHAQNHPKP